MSRLAFVGCLLVALAIPVRGGEPKHQPAPKVTATEALQRLKDGNARFVADKAASKTYTYRRAETAAGQKPWAIILTCADSRVAPELVFDQSLGDLFVVRVAGNVTDPVVLASIEYAALHLGPPLIVVLGHDKCGAVAAALDTEKADGNLGELLKAVHLGDKSGKDMAEKVDRAVRANAKFQAAEMLKQSKTLAELVKGERVQIVTGVYDLTTGGVQWLDAPQEKKK
jgi:carbonic anhydrase